VREMGLAWYKTRHADEKQPLPRTAVEKNTTGVELENNNSLSFTPCGELSFMPFSALAVQSNVLG